MNSPKPAFGWTSNFGSFVDHDQEFTNCDDCGDQLRARPPQQVPFENEYTQYVWCRICGWEETITITPDAPRALRSQVV